VQTILWSSANQHLKSQLSTSSAKPNYEDCTKIKTGKQLGKQKDDPSILQHKAISSSPPKPNGQK
jgi:hypothetical protein